jgi:hypothetical protein
VPDTNKTEIQFTLKVGRANAYVGKTSATKHTHRRTQLSRCRSTIDELAMLYEISSPGSLTAQGYKFKTSSDVPISTFLHQPSHYAYLDLCSVPELITVFATAPALAVFIKFAKDIIIQLLEFKTHAAV